MDNKSVITYKDTFQQNVEVLKPHLPTSIVGSYVESTDTYTKLTTDKERQQLKRVEEEKFLTFVLLRHSNQRIFGRLLKKWSAEFTQGRDEYPTGLNVITVELYLKKCTKSVVIKKVDCAVKTDAIVQEKKTLSTRLLSRTVLD